jgi:DNA-binding transcriptional ArsR family regulator
MQALPQYGRSLGWIQLLDLMRAPARTAGRAGLTGTLVRGSLRFVETYEAVLDALGDRTRRQIVQRLRAGPLSVGELAAVLPVSRPAVSQHLTVLRHSGLVRYSELGTRNVYRLDPAGLGELRAWLDGFWETALDRYADRVRQDRIRPDDQQEELRHA